MGAWLPVLVLAACSAKSPAVSARPDGGSTSSTTTVLSSSVDARALPMELLRPVADVQREWQPVGSSTAWEGLDDSAQQPSPITADSGYVTATAAGQVFEVKLAKPTLAGDPLHGTAWFYASTGADTELRAEVVWGGQIRATVEVTPNSSFQWHSVAFATSARADADDLRLRFTAGGGSEANVRAAYVEVKPPWCVAVVGSSVKVRPEGAVEGAAEANLFAAKNEFESFQVVVSALDEPVTGLNVAFAGPLVGPGGAQIPLKNVTIYREGYYTVQTPSDLEGSPGRWPDPLIPVVDPIFGEPRNAFPIDVPKGENRVAWVDVQVPVDAAAGLYRGTLQVAAEGRSAQLPIELKVLNFTLPSTTSLKSSFGLSLETQCAALGLEGCSDSSKRAYAKQLFVRAALDNRVSIAYPYASPITTPEGLNEFRTYSLPFLQGTAPTRLPGAKLTTFQVNRPKERDFGAWRDEVKVDGFEDRAFVYSCDEPEFFPVYGDPDDNWKVCRVALDQDQQTWPEAPKLITTHIQSSSKHGANDLFDIMVINVELLDGPADTPFFVGNQRPLYDAFLANSSRPKQLWLYAACGSHSCTRNDDPYTTGWAGYEIDAPASETRAMAWLAFSYDLNGTLYYDTGLQLSTAWDDQYRYTGNGEGTLFYPGTVDRVGGTQAVPIESLRLKQVREGYEDYEYMKFLSDHGLGDQAHQIARSLFPAPYDTARTDAQVQQARKALGDLIMGVVGN